MTQMEDELDGGMQVRAAEVVPRRGKRHQADREQKVPAPATLMPFRRELSPETCSLHVVPGSNG